LRLHGPGVRDLPAAVQRAPPAARRAHREDPGLTEDCSGAGRTPRDLCYARPSSTGGLMRRLLLLALVLLVQGCDGGPPPQSDAGPGSMCTDDSACDDGLFCNGPESCAPGAEGADARGCVQGARPCAETERCVEEMDLCRASCDVSADADG